MKNERSKELFEKAKLRLAGGVNSPVRAFKAVGGVPLFISRGSGSRIYDADGNEFIDYVCSWGPLILGHAHPQVIEAVRKVVGDGTSFGAPTGIETTLADMVCDAVPSIEMLRFVSSGTEATMSAIRLARGATGRNKIIKFAGCYHGHADSLLVEAGSGVATFGIPGSAGVPSAFASQTLVAEYNHWQSVENLFTHFPGEIAAVIVEPVVGNMGVVPPQAGFLEHLRAVTREYGAILIFDEVITGFRLAYGGAQLVYDIKPDLTCLGKIIGGGFPVAAYGGRRDIMEIVSPLGPVYQAGTLSGNPVAMTAGVEMLKILSQPEIYSRLEEHSALLGKGLLEAAKKAGVRVQVQRAGSVLTVFFTDMPVINYETAKKSDTSLYAKFFKEMLSRGIYLPPSQFEAWFISTAHSEQDVRFTIEAAVAAFRSLS
ncbi:glutamate-1-semialdehyde 2,1-aminomutase [Chloroflexota bacterium]